MEEERICPICGLKMEILSPQSWTCKCGHVEKGRIQEERKATREMERGRDKEEVRIRFWEKKGGKIRKETSLHHKEITDKKKRTGLRG